MTSNVINAVADFEDKIAVDSIIKVDEAIFALLSLPKEAIWDVQVIDEGEVIDGREAIVRSIRRLLELDFGLSKYKKLDAFFDAKGRTP